MGLTSSSSCISNAQEYIEPLYKYGGNKSIGPPLATSHFHKVTKIADYQSSTVVFPSPYPSAISLPSPAPLATTCDEGDGAVVEVIEKQPPQRPRTFTMDSCDEVSQTHLK